MHNVLITGTSRGIGRETALLFLENGYTVYGLDREKGSIENENYHHLQCDVSDKASLPDIDDISVLVNAAGVQNSGRDIAVNLTGTMNTTEKYGVREGIRAVVNIASASAHTGAEYPAYSASKGGIISYTRNVAIRIAPYGATCNSISPGGVLTASNSPVTEDEKLWNEIMALTPLRKWATEREIAEWIYFIAVVNRSMSGEDILIDNGESRLRGCFIWPEER